MFAILFVFYHRVNLITMYTKQAYPNNLREYRLKLGLRQKDVAKSLGLDFMDRLSRWENGWAIPNLVNLFKLANLYNVPADELYRELRQSIEKPDNPAPHDVVENSLQESTTLANQPACTECN